MGHTAAPATTSPPDAHAKPPESIKAFYKRLQKADKRELDARQDIVDCETTSESFASQSISESCALSVPSDLRTIFSDFVGSDELSQIATPLVYEVHEIPGKRLSV